MDQLKDKLRALISGTKTTKANISIQPPAEHEASMLGTSRTQVEQLRLAVETYDKKSQSLVRENEQLKALLDTVTKEISSRTDTARAADSAVRDMAIEQAKWLTFGCTRPLYKSSQP